MTGGVKSPLPFHPRGALKDPPALAPPGAGLASVSTVSQPSFSFSPGNVDFEITPQ